MVLPRGAENAIRHATRPRGPAACGRTWACATTILGFMIFFLIRFNLMSAIKVK